MSKEQVRSVQTKAEAAEIFSACPSPCVIPAGQEAKSRQMDAQAIVDSGVNPALCLDGITCEGGEVVICPAAEVRGQTMAALRGLLAHHKC